MSTLPVEVTYMGLKDMDHGWFCILKEPGVRAPWVESWVSRQGSEAVDITTSLPLTPQLLLLKADAIRCTPPQRVDGGTCTMTPVGP